MEGPRFSGRYEHSLDLKGRFVLPARFRQQFDAQAFLSQYQDGCLALWRPVEFNQRLDQLLEYQDRSPEDRNLARVWAGGSHEVEIDKQGRVPVPQYLQEYASLSRAVLVMGAIDRVELWSPQRWQERIRPAEHRMADAPDSVSQAAAATASAEA